MSVGPVDSDEDTDRELAEQALARPNEVGHAVSTTLHLEGSPDCVAAGSRLAGGASWPLGVAADAVVTAEAVARGTDEDQPLV